MDFDMKSKNNIFVVLPTFIINGIKFGTDMCDYHTIEPRFGKYVAERNIQCKRLPMEYLHCVISLSNSPDMNTCDSSIGMSLYYVYSEVSFTINGCKRFSRVRDENGKLVVELVPLSWMSGQYWTDMEWPFTTDNNKMHMLDDKLCPRTIDNVPSDIYRMIVDSTLKGCLEMPLIDIDGQRYLDCNKKKQFYKTEGKGISTDSRIFRFGISRKYMYYGDANEENNIRIVNLQTDEDFECNFKCIGLYEVVEGLILISPDGENYYLYLLDEDILPHPTINLEDIGTLLAEFSLRNIRNKHINRIIENPFKTKERDRLANWLYETISKQLPLTITGIITEYCTLVKYYDYDVLINYLQSQSEEN